MALAGPLPNGFERGLRLSRGSGGSRDRGSLRSRGRETDLSGASAFARVRWLDGRSLLRRGELRTGRKARGVRPAVEKARRCGHRGSLRCAAREGGLAGGLARSGDRQAVGIGRLRPVRTGRGGRRMLRSPAEPGDGEGECLGTLRSRPLRGDAAAPCKRTARRFGNGNRACRPRPCPRPAGNRPGLHGLDGTRGDRRPRSRGPSVPTHPAGDGPAEAWRS